MNLINVRRKALVLSTDEQNKLSFIVAGFMGKCEHDLTSPMYKFGKRLQEQLETKNDHV